ncbi:MAG TPA: FAD-dependent oxidoreductase [Terriglobales bacterium]|nr:FAD-dependent oxidoreductase [Terriglobales bacterium]
MIACNRLLDPFPTGHGTDEMAKSFDIVIVGGGIVGAACAWEAAQSGFSVAVIEADVVGGGATAAGMGHIVVMDDSEPQFALTRYSQQLWNELRAELPADVEFENTGTIWVAADEEEMQAVRQKYAFYTSHGVPAQILDSYSLAEGEPHLRRGLAGGLLVPEDAVIYSPAAARWLLGRAQHLEATLVRGRAKVLRGSSVLLNDGSSFNAGWTVNATGATARLLTDCDVKKRKGHLVITDRRPGLVRHQLVELGYLKSAHSLTTDSVAFNVQPRKTGQLLIGSSRQYGAEDPAVEHRMIREMLARAVAYIPELAQTSAIRCWTGFRAATADKLPLIGPSKNDERLWLATGHEGLGITTSLATAKLLVDQIAGRRSAIPVEPYLPARSFREHEYA